MQLNGGVLNSHDLAQPYQRRPTKQEVRRCSLQHSIIPAGADDYLTKPFDFDELVARIEALTRRARAFDAGEGTPDVIRCGALSFNRTSLEVTVGDRRVDLSEKERELVKLLIGNVGKVCSRERILNTVWGVNEDPLTNVVDVYISRLRKKLGDDVAIETVRGIGYRLSTSI